MSSLSKQLTNLKSQQPNIKQGPQEKVEVASLIFSSKVSAAIDVETVYSIALQGYQNLTSIDSRFGKYQEVVLGSQYKRIDRTTLTEEENQDLSQKLKKVILYLSLYFLNEDAQKVFDYLLRNFKIHIFEMEECVIYFMHYSSTIYFNRLMQNLDLKNSKHFSFLGRFAEKDQIMYRSTLVKQITYDSYILVKLIEYNQKISSLKQSSDIVVTFDQGEKKQAIKITPDSFLLALLVEILGVKRSSENFLQIYTEVIAKFITKAENSTLLSFALSLLVSLIIKEQAKISVSLVQNFTNFLLAQLGKQLPKQNISAILKTVVFLSQRGMVLKEIGIKNLQNLLEFYEESENNKKIMKQIFGQYSVLSLLVYVLKSFVQLEEQEQSKFEGFLQFLFGIVLETDHSYKYSQDIKFGFAQEVIVMYFENTLYKKQQQQQNQDDEENSLNCVQSILFSLIKSNLQGDMIYYLSKKLKQKNQIYNQFIQNNYPSLIQIYEKNQQFFNFNLYSNEEEDQTQIKQSLKSLLQQLKSQDEQNKAFISEYSDYFRNILLAQFQISSKKQNLQLILQCFQKLPNVSDYLGQILVNIIRFVSQVDITTLSDLSQDIQNLIINQFREQDVQDLKLELSKFYLIFMSRQINSIENCEQVENTIEEEQKQLQDNQQENQIVFDLEKLEKKIFQVEELGQFYNSDKLDIFIQSLKLVQFEREQELEEQQFKLGQIILLINILKNLQGSTELFSQKVVLFDILLQNLKEVKYNQKSQELVTQIIENQNIFLQNQQQNLTTDQLKLQQVFLDFIFSFEDLQVLKDLKEQLSKIQDKKVQENFILVILKNLILSQENENQTEIQSQVQNAKNLKQLMVLLALLKQEENTDVLRNFSLIFFYYFLTQFKDASSNEKRLLIQLAEILKKSMLLNNGDNSVYDINLGEFMSFNYLNKNQDLNVKLGNQVMREEIIQLLDVFLKNKLQFSVKSNVQDFVLGQAINKKQIQVREVNFVEKVVQQLMNRIVCVQQENQQFVQELIPGFLNKNLNIIVEIVISTERIGEDFKVDFLRNLKKILIQSENSQRYKISQKNYYSLYFSLKNISQNFEELFLGSLEFFKIANKINKYINYDTYGVTQINKADFSEQLDQKCHLALFEYLINNVDKFDYGVILNHVSEFALQQEDIKYLLLQLQQLYNQDQTQRSNKQVKQLNLILEIFLLQGNNNNVNPGSFYNLLEQSKDLHSYQTYLMLKLLKDQVNYQILKAKKTTNVEELLGQFDKKSNQYQYLNIVNNLLIQQDIKNPLQLDIIRVCVGILSLQSKINFKQTSNLIYEFLRVSKQKLFKLQEQQDNKQSVGQEEEELEQEFQQQIQEQEQVQLELINGLYVQCVENLLRNNPDKQEKCVKFMHSHLEVFFNLLSKYSNAKISRNIQKKSEQTILQVVDLYGSVNLHVLFLCSMQNISKIIAQFQQKYQSQMQLPENQNISVQMEGRMQEKLQEKINSIFNLFLTILIQNFLQPGERSLQFASALTKCQVFISQVLTQYAGITVKNDQLQSQQMDQQQYYLLAKTLNISQNQKGQEQIMKNQYLLFKSVFNNDQFLKLMEQVILHIQGQEFLEIISQFYQQILKFEVKLKNFLTNLQEICDKQKSSSAINNQGMKQKKRFLKDLLAANKKQSEYISNILPLDYFLEICAFGLAQEKLEYSIKQHIIEKIGSKLESINLKKKYQDKLALILSLCCLDLQNKKDIFVNPKKKVARNYLQQLILFFVQIAQKKPQLIKNLDTEKLIDNLMYYFENIGEFVMRNSLLLLFAQISSVNKYKVLEHLNVIMKEIATQFLALLKYSQNIQVDLEEQIDSIVKIAQKIYPSRLELVQDLERQDLVKNKLNLSGNNLPIFKMLVSSTLQLIQALQNLTTPYLLPFMNILLLFISEENYAEVVEDFCDKLTQYLTPRVLIEKTLQIVEISQSLSPQAVKCCAYYLSCLFDKLEAEEVEEFASQIYKKYIKFLDYTRTTFINNELYEEKLIDSIENTQIEALTKFILKTNEVQLRKMFLNIVTWSEKKFEKSQCGYGFEQYRKILLTKLIINLSQELGQLFASFFTFVFENLVANLQELKQFFTIENQDSDENQEENQETKNKKRKLQEFEDSNLEVLQLKLLKLVINCFTELFEHDKGQFLDNQKVEQLTDPLLDLYEVNKIPDYVAFTEQYLIPSVVNFFDGLTDDYKWKSINYNLMLRQRNESVKVKLALVKTVSSLVDKLGERFIILINDVLPFLSENLDEPSVEVEALTKQLVIKLENLSGENIRDYFKSVK